MRDSDDPNMTRLKEVTGNLRDRDRLADDPALIQQIIDSLPDALLVVSSDMKVLLVNKQMELMFGYTRNALLGSNFDILLPKEIHERHAILFDGYFRAPSVRPMNMARPLKALRRDGREIEVQINLSPIVSEQGVLGLALLRNVF